MLLALDPAPRAKLCSIRRPDGVGPSSGPDPTACHEGPVDRLGVRAPRVEPVPVGAIRGDAEHVLAPVERASHILGGRVHPHPQQAVLHVLADTASMT